jgi:hypothetical protein
MLPDDGTHGVPKHVGGDYVHLLCIYASALKVGFISRFVHYTHHTHNIKILNITVRYSPYLEQ